MKKIIFAVLILMTSIVNAAETTVFETNLRKVTNYSEITTRFSIDMNTHEGFISVVVAEELYKWPTTQAARMVRIFADKVKIDGLMMIGDKVIFHGAEGNVDCGTMGVSRVFKTPTLYLSGNCSIGSVLVDNGTMTKLILKLQTK